MIAALSNRTLQLAGLLRLKPFDSTTAEGRSRERHRRAALTALSAATARLLSVSTALISVPLTLHYLGAERYGLWMAVTSIIVMLYFADFGMGNGVLNAVAESHGRDDRESLRQQIASGFFILTLIAAAVLLLFLWIYPLVAWDKLLNVQSAVARSEAGPALAVFAIAFALNIPLGIVQKVQLGLQQGFTANLWQAAGSLLGLGGVLMAIHWQCGLPWLVAAMAGAPLLAALFNSIQFFAFTQPDLAPRLRYVSRPAIHRLARSGALFFVLQICAALAFASDNFIIARTLGAAAVTTYAVPEKLFNLIPVVLTMVLAPLWPAYGEAIARGDGPWVRRTFKRAMTAALCFAGTASVLLILFGAKIISLWVGHAIVPPLLLLMGMGLWKVMEGAGNALTTFLNGAGALRLQSLQAVAMALSALVLKVLLIAAIGLPGVVFATAAAYLLFVLLPSIYFVPKILRRVVAA